MKLSIKLLSIFVPFALFCGSLSATVTYVGADAQLRSATLSGMNKHSFSKHSPAINVYAGAKFENCLGFEFGGHLGNVKKSSQKTRLRGLHASLLGYYPLDVARDVKLVGGIGVSHIRNKYQHPLYQVNLSKMSPRVMGGAEVELTESVNWRTTLISENVIRLRMEEHHVNPSFGIATGLSAAF